MDIPEFSQLNIIFRLTSVAYTQYPNYGERDAIVI